MRWIISYPIETCTMENTIKLQKVHLLLADMELSQDNSHLQERFWVTIKESVLIQMRHDFNHIFCMEEKRSLSMRINWFRVSLVTISVLWTNRIRTCVLNVCYGQILRKLSVSSPRRMSKKEKNSLFRMAASTQKSNLRKNLCQTHSVVCTIVQPNNYPANTSHKKSFILSRRKTWLVSSVTTALTAMMDGNNSADSDYVDSCSY